MIKLEGLVFEVLCYPVHLHLWVVHNDLRVEHSDTIIVTTLYLLCPDRALTRYNVDLDIGSGCVWKLLFSPVVAPVFNQTLEVNIATPPLSLVSGCLFLTVSFLLFLSKSALLSAFGNFVNSSSSLVAVAFARRAGSHAV